MAAYYAGLHKRLKDNSVPIADRVKLARFGWVSNHCFLPNKHQVLLDWVSFRLVNIEKDGTSDADEQSLWLFLHDALKSQEMSTIQREGKPICLRGNLCSALLSTLLKDDVSDIVIGCCDMILTNEKLRFVQNTKFESLIAMTVAFVEMASKQLEENVCLEEHGQILRVMGKALAKSANLLQQQQNGKKAYGLTSEQLILPCLRLYSILSSHRHGNNALCAASLNALNSSVRSLLFSRNMAEAYKMYLMAEEGDKQKKDGRVRADVVDKFMDFLQSKSGEASTACGLPVMYSAFLTSFKPSPDLTFAMLQKMCGLMDFKTDDQPSGSCDDASWDRKLCTMEALLKLATSHKCYAAVEEETERTKKMEWFKEIVSHLMANKRLHPSWYGCLDIIFSLDHNILATRMQEVWPCLLATNVNNASMATPMKDQNDDADAAKVGESRDAFLKSVMETYTKLRQIDRLTKVLLSSILTKKEFSSSIQLPASFLTSFGAAVESLTPGSTVALWDIILSDLTTNHLPAVIHQTSQSSVDPPPAKKKRKVNKQVAGINGDAVARFEAVATVLHTFLMNSKMADAAEVGQVKGQVLKLFDMMADDVLKPLLGIFSHENQSLAFSTLLLCYGWGELHLMLRQHTNLMERVPLPTLNTPMKNGDVHYLHTYSHASDWLRVMSPTDAEGNVKLCFLKHQLLWQQARGLVLLGNLEESSVKESLTSCISQALELSVERSESKSGRWDGLIGHATQSNIYTALLTSLLRQSLTLFTFMDESMHSSVAGLVCQAVCGSMHSEDNTNECSACTVRNAALGFLDSEACRESRPMQNAVVNAVADQLKELNKSLEVANASSSKKDGRKGKKQPRAIQHSKGNQMLSVEDNFKTGVNLLEVLKHLPLLHLSAGNRVKCMLGLVSLDTKTVTCVETMTSAGRQQSCDLVELSTEVRRLLTAILKGVQQGDEVLRNEELNTWFFSFLSELGNLLSQEDSRLATTPEYKEVSKGLISLWLKKATWSGDSVTMFNKYLKSFHQHIVKCLQKLKSSKKPASLPGVSTVLSIVVTLLNQIALACRHKTADAESKELLGLTGEVSSSVFQLLGQILASTSRQDSNHQLTDVLKSARTLLLSFESTQKLNRRAKEEEEEDKDKEETDKSSSRDGCGPNSSHSPHFTTCYQRALSVFSAELKTVDDSDAALMGSSLGYLESHCSIIRNPLESRAVWSQLHTSLAKVSRKCHSSVKQQLEGLLIITLGVMETDDLNAELQQMLTSLTLGDDSAHVIGVLQAWQLLPSAMLSNESYILVMEMLPQILKRCQKLLHGTVQMQPLDGTLIVAILTTVAKFISQGKDLLAAEHAIPTMHLCLLVPWDDIPASHFPSCFAAAFRILNDLMMCYSGPVLKAVSAYISCVNRLLSALVERCSQQTPETMKVTDQQLISCAENMQRLLSLIASLKGDISQYGIYLIADYISGLQKTTLPSQVKTPLVGGVYKIVDVCDEKTLSLLNVTLPVSLKEIFRSFYVDYKKHHKYTGHV